MRNMFKYFLLAVGVIVTICLAAVVIIPLFVSVDDYKPQIEELVSRKTGFPAVLAGDIDVTLFPWIGLSFSDLQLNNPAGFTDDEFIRIKGFQARLKLMPLLSGTVEIDRFIVNEPSILLIKNEDGTWNFEKQSEHDRQQTPGAGTSAPPPPGRRDGSPSPPGRELPLASLAIGELSINDGTLRIVDQAAKSSRELTSLNLKMTDISLTQPVKVNLEARLDGEPLEVSGSFGPLGSDPLTDRFDLDLLLNAFGTLSLRTTGTLGNLQHRPAYHLQLAARPFNVRTVLAAVGAPLPFEPADESALTSLAFEARVDGDDKQLEVGNARLTLDQTTVDLTLNAKDFSRPDLTIDLKMDAIDLDRYLPAPPASESPETVRVSSAGGASAPATASETGAPAGPKRQPGPEPPGQTPAIDYEPLRRLVIDAAAAIDSCRIRGGTLESVSLALNGSNGLFTVSSMGLKLYGGSLVSTGSLDVQRDTPAVALNLNLDGVQVGPLLRDFARKDVLEGTAKATVGVNFSGADAAAAKRSLNGSGTLLFRDGALVGLDLAMLARTIKSGFTLQKQEERPRTDFAELKIPFSLKDGVFSTPEASLKSPFIRARAVGEANLVNERLDLRLEPKLVGTIKGQGDDTAHTGVSIPVIVGGTFSSPTFRPDLEALARDELMQRVDRQEVDEIMKSGTITPERRKQLKEEVEKAKGLLKGLFGN